MFQSPARRFVPVTALATALLAAPSAAVAAPPAQVPDLSFELPAGTGCSFALGVSGTDSRAHIRTLEDRNGDVRVITAGAGYYLTYTNLDTGATYSSAPSGSVSELVVHEDGSSTLTLMGHNDVILFPTDIPAGPSTTHYVGRVVFEIDAQNNWTLMSATGTTSDICAALD